MRLNDLLEEDLRTLKETDFMGPATRAEFNRRKALASGPVTSRERNLARQKYSISSVDEILQKPKAEQLDIMRKLFH